MVLSLVYGFCATVAHAGGGGYVNPISYKIDQLTVPRLYGASMTYGSGTFLANDNQGNVFQLENGSWSNQGFKLWRAVWAPSGVYGYSNGYASVYRNGQTNVLENGAQFSTPYIQPSIGPSGQVSFGRMSIDFVLTVNPDGSSTACLPFSTMGSGPWWVTNTAFASNNVVYYSGQNTTNPINNGYRVVGRFYGGFADTGMAYSEIAVSNGFLWGVSPNHDYIDGWQLDANGSVVRSKTVMSGGYFNILGTDNSGVVFQQGSLVWHTSPVPEPGSFLALMTGLAGLGGFVLRRRK